MTSSLVGSEMCIRDRHTGSHISIQGASKFEAAVSLQIAAKAQPACPEAVSYTHLTLPTICSV
eukprot:4351106-Prorocentrum_lima.AAC.1